jgi:hypothetical protein
MGGIDLPLIKPFAAHQAWRDDLSASQAASRL